MDSASLRDKALLGLFIAAISWSSNRLIDAYRTDGVAAAEARAGAELRSQLILCRNRELDDVKQRLRDAETRRP